MITPVAFGERNEDQDPGRLLSDRARAILGACGRVEGFTVVELRHASQGHEVADVIVVESFNGEVPSRNEPRIFVTEELAIVVPVSADQLPDVRALRADFPLVPHLNDVRRGEPASLCLYFEPWSAVERTWTPERFLQRIRWWMASTARGTLHRNDQPLERLYYASPLELVLPPDFHERIADTKDRLEVTFRGDDKKGTLNAVFVPRGSAAAGGQWIPLSVRASEAVVHGRIERPPRALGELEDQLAKRGSGVLAGLRAHVRNVVADGIEHREKQHCLMLISVPVRRSSESDDSELEDQALAFGTPISLAELGLALGALNDPEYDKRTGLEAAPGKAYFPVQLLGGAPLAESSKWRDVPLEALSVAPVPSKAFARLASEVPPVGAEFQGVLAGVGALGGSLGELWAKAAWGTWTLVDDDVLRSHNVVRHIGKAFQVGMPKASVVGQVMGANYAIGYYKTRAISASIRSPDESVSAAIREAHLLVDASTTFEVPRDLARLPSRPRIASLFLTPSGRDSVLLLEDIARHVPVDALEAQYYRALLNAPWGRLHLVGHSGELWVGAGCRDVSQVLSFGIVQLHASILAEQLRRLVPLDSPRICVWSSDEHLAITFSEVTPEPIVEEQRGGWRVLLDQGMREQLRRLRQARLPVETGGIVLGYTDHKTGTIAVVDVLPAPPDSVERNTGFIRGVEGLETALKRVKTLTANVVGYVGEWHSHPPFHAPTPSGEDRKLLATLRAQLQRDGDPVVMLIVGAAGEVSIHVNGVES